MRTKKQALACIGANIAIVWFMALGMINFNHTTHMPHLLAFALTVLAFIYIMPGILDETRDCVNVFKTKENQ